MMVRAGISNILICFKIFCDSIRWLISNGLSIIDIDSITDYHEWACQCRLLKRYDQQKLEKFNLHCGASNRFVSAILCVKVLNISLQNQVTEVCNLFPFDGVHPCVRSFVRFFRSFSQFVCLSVCLSVCLYVPPLSVRACVCVSVRLSVNQLVSQSVCISDSLSVCLSVCLCVCVCVCVRLLIVTGEMYNGGV